jgi:hypothetical protein
VEPAEALRAKRLFPESQFSWTYVDRQGNFFPSQEED